MVSHSNRTRKLSLLCTFTINHEGRLLVVTLLTKKRIPEPKLTNPKPHQRSVVLLFSLSCHLTKGRPPWLASLFDAQQMIIEVT